VDGIEGNHIIYICKPPVFRTLQSLVVVVVVGSDGLLDRLGMQIKVSTMK